MKRKQSKNNVYFDDCPICQALKKAEEEDKDLSLEELEEVFEKAKGQGAIVGKFSDQVRSSNN